jgi:hypothetical protein
MRVLLIRPRENLAGYIRHVAELGAVKLKLTRIDSGHMREVEDSID